MKIIGSFDSAIIKILIFKLVLCTALLLTTAPASAQNSTINNAETSIIAPENPVEKFYAMLPQAKDDYKSPLRPILIEGAMNAETEVLVRALENPVTYRDLNYLFVAGTYKNYPVVIVRTEQCMANAAASTALAIKKFNPIAVINQGTAGGHDPSLKVGDIVIGGHVIDYAAIKTAYKPAGAGADLTDQEMDGTFAYDATSGTFKSYKEYLPDSTLLKIAQKIAAENKNFNAITGTISTADSWLNNVDYINFLHEKYGSSCEEMESNAVAQICQNAGVPFIGIRVISNNILRNENFDLSSAKIAQDFLLLVVENYIGIRNKVQRANNS